MGGRGAKRDALQGRDRTDHQGRRGHTTDHHGENAAPSWTESHEQDGGSGTEGEGDRRCVVTRRCGEEGTGDRSAEPGRPSSTTTLGSTGQQAEGAQREGRHPAVTSDVYRVGEHRRI